MFGKKIILAPSSFRPNKKICRKCGAEMDDTVNCCTKCGHKKFFKTFDEYKETTYMYCAKCKEPNINNDRFCPNCGRSRFVSYEKKERLLDKEWDRKITGNTNKKKFGKFLLILSAIAAVALILFGVWAIIQSGGETWAISFTVIVGYSFIMTIPLVLDKRMDWECSHWIALAISLVSLLPMLWFGSSLESCVWGISISIALTLNNLIGLITCSVRGSSKKGVKTYLIMTIIYALMILCLFMYRSDLMEAYYYA